MTSPADLADSNTPRQSLSASTALIRNPPLAESEFTERFLSRAEVLLITSTSCSFIYKKMEEGAFPRPVPLGGRRVAWLLSEVRQWMKERLQARDS